MLRNSINSREPPSQGEVLAVGIDTDTDTNIAIDRDLLRNSMDTREPPVKMRWLPLAT